MGSAISSRINDRIGYVFVAIEGSGGFAILGSQSWKALLEVSLGSHFGKSLLEVTLGSHSWKPPHPEVRV